MRVGRKGRHSFAAKNKTRCATTTGTTAAMRAATLALLLSTADANRTLTLSVGRADESLYKSDSDADETFYLDLTLPDPPPLPSCACAVEGGRLISDADDECWCPLVVPLCVDLQGMQHAAFWARCDVVNNADQI